MKQAVKTGLPAPSSPIEWATLADGILYTAQVKPMLTYHPTNATI